jgi:hypothetical protein
MSYLRSPVAGLHGFSTVLEPWENHYAEELHKASEAATAAATR